MKLSARILIGFLKASGQPEAFFLFYNFAVYLYNMMIKESKVQNEF